MVVLEVLFVLYELNAKHRNGKKGLIMATFFRDSMKKNEGSIAEFGAKIEAF